MRFFATARQGDAATVRSTAREYERAGISGVVASDHLFIAIAGRPGREAMVLPQPDPFTLLAAYGMASDRLELATMMASCQLAHPALISRAALQLAALFGDRVILGLGAGWQAEEPRALGREPLRAADAGDALAEAIAIVRTQWAEGVVSFSGRHFMVRELPAAPAAETCPRLAVGGASERVLRLGAEHADLVDVEGCNTVPPTASSTAYGRVLRRKVLSTVEGLAAQTDEIHTLASRAGRPPPVISIHPVCVTVTDAPDRDPDVVGIATRTGTDVDTVLRSAFVLAGSRDQVEARLAALEGTADVGLVVVGEPQVPAVAALVGE